MFQPVITRSITDAASRFLAKESSGGVVLMISASVAIILANSPLKDGYSDFLDVHLGALSIQHWINDGLMTVFFLLVGLEIKREMLIGQLAGWGRRILPCAAAAGGMLMPALFYSFFNWDSASTLQGWAIPTATDIAFALGVLSLLGPRVPSSLKIFLAALAISDDLGAVVVIAVFYTSTLNTLAIGAAISVLLGLALLNRMKIEVLWLYLVFGFALWGAVFASGIHATLAGVLLAMSIPLALTSEHTQNSRFPSPLHLLEHRLAKPVAFIVVPIFGFANAGVSFAGVSVEIFSDPVTMGVAVGLFAGKFLGVLGTVVILVRSGVADLPENANWRQVAGTALLCGIGFTMSLFIGMLAFDDLASQNHAKIGILLGSVTSGILGAFVLKIACRKT